MQTRKQAWRKSRTGEALIPSVAPRHLPLVTKGRQACGANLRQREGQGLPLQYDENLTQMGATA